MENRSARIKYPPSLKATNGSYTNQLEPTKKSTANESLRSVVGGSGAN